MRINPFIKIKCSSCGNEELVYYASTFKPAKRCVVCDEILYTTTGGHCKTLGHQVIKNQATDE